MSIDQNLRNLLTVLVAILTEQERAVIVLYYHDDRSFEEISEIMDISVSQVFQIYSKAMSDLKNYVMYGNRAR